MSKTVTTYLIDGDSKGTQYEQNARQVLCVLIIILEDDIDEN